MYLLNVDYRTLFYIAITLIAIIWGYVPIYKDQKMIQQFGAELHRYAVERYWYLVTLGVTIGALCIVWGVYITVTDTYTDAVYCLVFSTFAIRLWYHNSRDILIYKHGIVVKQQLVPWEEILHVEQTTHHLELATQNRGKLIIRVRSGPQLFLYIISKLDEIK